MHLFMPLWMMDRVNPFATLSISLWHFCEALNLLFRNVLMFWYLYFLLYFLLALSADYYIKYFQLQMVSTTRTFLVFTEEFWSTFSLPWSPSTFFLRLPIGFVCFSAMNDCRLIIQDFERKGELWNVPISFL